MLLDREQPHTYAEEAALLKDSSSVLEDSGRRYRLQRPSLDSPEQGWDKTRLGPHRLPAVFSQLFLEALRV